MQALLLDEGLPLRTAANLRNKGFDVVHVREIGLRAAADTAILAFAKAENRACVTLDHDFHMLLAATRRNSPTVIFIRERKLNYREAAELISRLVIQLGAETLNGPAVTATGRSVRLRRLPLKPR